MRWAVAETRPGEGGGPGSDPDAVVKVGAKSEDTKNVRDTKM